MNWNRQIRRIVLLLCGLVLRHGVVAHGADDVELTLRIPSAATRVIGDSIPLYWGFRSSSSQALGFIWEGCCRLNGKLDVSRADGGPNPEPVAPGQALAHMFAKADRLAPGVMREYETRLSDWIVLTGSGRYSLEGGYRGVLPSQSPQVPRGLSLWRGAARSRPLEIEVLAVRDYLPQRDMRAARRGLKPTMRGPGRFSTAQSTRWEVVFEATGTSETAVRWPDDLSLWIVDVKGVRVAPSAVIVSETTNLWVRPGAPQTRAFVVAPDRMESEPLGEYTMFVDAAETPEGLPRVPSNPIAVSWELDDASVRELVEQASRGAGAGARNPPLKLLRVYLPEVGQRLAAVDRSGWDTAAGRLADRLVTASRLRDVSPRPGTVELALEVGPGGVVRWKDERIRTALEAKGSRDLEAQVRELQVIRRHLGWDLRLVLEPVDAAGRDLLESAVRDLTKDPGEWAGPPLVKEDTRARE